MKHFLPAAILFLAVASLIAQDDETPADNSDGLPTEYADFLVSHETLSPDGKMAVIYPKLEVCEDDSDTPAAATRCQNYLVQLQPFQILTKIATDSPHFQSKSHGGLSIAWAQDQSAVLVTVEGKWGPDDIFLYQLSAGKVIQSTNFLRKVHDLLAPSFKKSRPSEYNDNFDFIFENDEEQTPLCQFTDPSHIRVKGYATNDPKGIADKPWHADIAATWDVTKEKFTSQKISGTFTGKR
ncbi:MAG: hypothetical protein ABI946_04530 [Chthoniobacterales bacterium]